MSEPEATPAGETPPDAPAAPAFDPGVIRGLQLFAPAGEAAVDGLDEAARKEALVQALAARAARFAEAVDDALTLASDGTIRWLGDPIGKLIVGVGSLEPGATLLADEALPPEGREAAERRLSLWIAAHLHKVLGPLIALADAHGAPEAARSVALKVSQALGVLERERVKAEVKALDQEARGALRKLGVRFGAHYIYVPALLKPAARTLCAQLWALAQPGVDQEGAERLLHFAASGRTSFAVEPPASAELCRIAGFRLCGDRAVRVDIVERLSDLIRAALPRSPTPGPADEADGFVVTGQMTSLTGCSGEPFASILRSLGFVAHRSRSRPIWRRSRAAPPPPPPLLLRQPPSPRSSFRPRRKAKRRRRPRPSPSRPRAQPQTKNRRSSRPPRLSRNRRRPRPRPSLSRLRPRLPATSRPSPPPSTKSLRRRSPSSPRPRLSRRRPKARFRRRAKPLEPAAEAPPAEAAPTESASAESAPSEPAPAEEETIEVWRPAPRRPRHAPHHHRYRDHHPQRVAGAVEGGGPSAQDGVRAQDGPRAQDGRGRKPWRERQASGNASGMHRGTRRRTAPVPRPPPASSAATLGLAKAGAVRRNGAARRARKAIAATIGATASRRRSGRTRTGRGRRRPSRASTSTRRSPSCSPSSRCCRGATKTSEAVRGGRRV